MANDSWQSWWRLLKWPIAIGVIAWLIGANLGGIRELLQAGVEWRWVLAAAGLRFAAILLGAARWRMLLAGQGIHPGYRRTLRLFSTGYVCNFLLPGTMGGDAARAGLIAVDSPDQRMRAVATVPLDRLLGLLAFVSIGALAGLDQWNVIPDGLLRTSVVVLVGCALVGIVGLVLLLSLTRNSLRFLQVSQKKTSQPAVLTAKEPDHIDERQRSAGHELLYGLALLRGSRQCVGKAFVFALLGHWCLSMGFFCCLQAFTAADLPAGAVAHLWLVPSAEIPATMLPLPGGVGAREGALALMYGALASNPSLSDHFRDVGVVVAATFSTVSFVLAVLLAGWLTLTGSLPRRRQSQADASG